MRITQSKATLFVLGLASWSIPNAAFAVSEPAGVAKNALAPPALRHDLALASAVPLSDQELENARGGFSVGGIDFNFGASVQTLVNGQLALQTNVQWTSTGAVVTQLQGLGASIQAQVESNLANAGIIVPTTNGPAANSTAGATSDTSPVPSAASNMASTAGNIAPSGGSLLPAASSEPALSTVNRPAAVSNSPAPATTVPINIVNVSPTASGTGPTSSPLPSLIGQNDLQNSPGNSASSAQSLTANSQVTTVAMAPSNNGNPAPSGASNIAPLDSSVAPASNSPAVSVSNNPTMVSGIQIQSPTGTTQVFANVANGQIQSLIVNSASYQNIVQNTNIILTIYNLASLRQLSAQHAMSVQLASQVLAASGFTGGR